MLEQIINNILNLWWMTPFSIALGIFIGNKISQRQMQKEYAPYIKMIDQLEGDKNVDNYKN